jgi:hypothetical protein
MAHCLHPKLHPRRRSSWLLLRKGCDRSAPLAGARLLSSEEAAPVVPKTRSTKLGSSVFLFLIAMPTLTHTRASERIMKKNTRAENPRDLAERMRKQKTQIQSLRSQIKELRGRERTYLSAIAEWHQQMSWVREKLNHIEVLLSSDSTSAAGVRTHRARSGSN